MSVSFFFSNPCVTFLDTFVQSSSSTRSLSSLTRTHYLSSSWTDSLTQTRYLSSSWTCSLTWTHYLSSSWTGSLTRTHYLSSSWQLLWLEHVIWAQVEQQGLYLSRTQYRARVGPALRVSKFEFELEFEVHVSLPVLPSRRRPNHETRSTNLSPMPSWVLIPITKSSYTTPKAPRVWKESILDP
jgi:hypothetical protein